MEASITEPNDRVIEARNHILALDCGPELIDLARRSPLPSRDISSIFETVTNADPSNQLLVDNVMDLLKRSDKRRVRQKIDQRQNAKRVDLMDLAVGFTDREVANILQHTYCLQMTDGCTVGCPWCGLCAKRGVEQSFSFSSVKNFLTKFGRNVRQSRILPYHASDPFDWMEEDNSYIDLFDLIIRTTRAFPFTSTAIPEGAEFQILSFIDQLYGFWKSLNVSEQQLFDDVIRFSRTKANSQRIDTILTISKAKGIEEEFLKNINLADRNIRTIDMTGYFINHPKRDEIFDSTGTACFDGTFISPNGFMSTYVESVTGDNPTGTQNTVLVPGRQEIPRYLNLNRYADTKISWGAGTILPFLPAVELEIFEDGHLTGIRRIDSVRRIALALGLVRHQAIFTSGKMEEAKKEPDALLKLLHIIRPIRRVFEPNFVDRVKSCRGLYEVELDKEAVRTAEHLSQVMERWLGLRAPV